MRDFYFPKGGLSMKPLNIPVGISDFSEIRKNGYYYVDKSFLIRELLKLQKNWRLFFPAAIFYSMWTII